ncbi:Serine/threonine-protein kinase ULK4 [Liparis tanakae]|uniref:Serine/threonine-protein kinase ULK4 n=1 Tax=Liparis tanakae TaxID=230148 RepID=A0A4Z2E2B4_9TELE|nr:Serine/threonine-protein kinase ULK4 [Liparis tanakae]
MSQLEALSRLTKASPAVFLALVDACGPEAVLEAAGGAGARVQQHLLTAVAAALLSSSVHAHRVAQSRVRGRSPADAPPHRSPCFTVQTRLD